MMKRREFLGCVIGLLAGSVIPFRAKAPQPTKDPYYSTIFVIVDEKTQEIAGPPIDHISKHDIVFKSIQITNPICYTGFRLYASNGSLLSTTMFDHPIYAFINDSLNITMSVLDNNHRSIECQPQFLAIQT